MGGQRGSYRNSPESEPGAVGGCWLVSSKGCPAVEGVCRSCVASPGQGQHVCQVAAGLPSAWHRSAGHEEGTDALGCSTGAWQLVAGGPRGWCRVTCRFYLVETILSSFQSVFSYVGKGLRV